MATGGKPHSKPGSLGFNQLPKPWATRAMEELLMQSQHNGKYTLSPTLTHQNLPRVLSGGERATWASDFSKALS